MSLYKLKGGQHNHSDGKTYKKGDLVESEADLTKIFTNKFEKVYETEEEASPGVSFPAVKVAQAKSKVTVVDLPVDSKEEEEKELEEVEEKIEEKPEKRGKEVTKNFSEAVEQDLKVFKKGRQYFVYDMDPAVPLNEKGLNKGQVKKFITDYLET